MNTDLSKITTLTGIMMAELPEFLDKELPADAYKAVPGAVGLTDINPNYMRMVLDEAFGMCGLGWGYSYSAESVAVSQFTKEVTRNNKQVEKTSWQAQISHFVFWYVLVQDGEQTRHEIPATGASDNDVAAYALKGAITASIGNAVSNIGFQRSVYLGKRDHNTVKVQKATTQKNGSAKPAASSAKSAPKPEKTSAAVNDFSSHLIPTGPKAGQQLGAQDLKTITFYAHKMNVAGDAEKVALQQAARGLLKVRGNGHVPVATVA